jgi:FixJ family two-component response regulator
MSAAGRAQGTGAADGFIHKPFDLALLLDVIEHYIGTGSEKT